MKITYLGHSAFHIETAGKSLLFDPFISPNALAAHIDIQQLSADYILISHGHADHVADVETIAKATGAKIISNFEIVTWFGKQQIKGIPLNHGGPIEFDFGTLKYVHAVHSSSLPDESYGGNPGGFVIWNSECAFYFSGDTALTWDMKLIPMTCPKLDIAIFPIGSHFTMDASDAALAAEFVDCDRVIGCHYNTMDIIQIDPTKAKAVFEDKGRELILLPIGESIDV